MKYVLPVLAGLAAASIAVAQPVMKPGLWEMTINVEMPGTTQKMQPTRLTHCYRAADLRDLRQTIPDRADCKVEDWERSGNVVTWKTDCRGEVAATMTGRMTYDGDHYSGVARISMNRGRRILHLTQKYDARRIGSCR